MVQCVAALTFYTQWTVASPAGELGQARLYQGSRDASAYRKLRSASEQWNQLSEVSPALLRVTAIRSMLGQLAILENEPALVPLTTFVSNGVLSEAHAVRLVLPLVEAAELARARDVQTLHIDPETVVATPAGELRLLFSPMRVADLDLTLEGFPVGPRTLQCYRAPELMDFDPALTMPSDTTICWELACLLYHLLMGHPPFPQDPPSAHRGAILVGAAPDMRAISPPLASLLQEVLVRNPDNRLPLGVLHDRLLAFAAPADESLELDDPLPAPTYPKHAVAPAIPTSAPNWMLAMVVGGTFGACCIIVGQILALLILRIRGEGSICIVP